MMESRRNVPHVDVGSGAVLAAFPSTRSTLKGSGIVEMADCRPSDHTTEQDGQILNPQVSRR